MRHLIAVLSLLCVSWYCSFGQSSDPAAEFGFKPYGSFNWGEIDSVNLLNLNLNVRIPLVSVPQRGGKDFSFSIVYSQPTLTYILDGTNCTPSDPRTCNTDWALTGAGIDIVPDAYPLPPVIESNGTISFFMSDGTAHAHVASSTYVQDGSGYFVTGTRSSTGCTILGTTFYDEIVVITDPVGTRYTYHAPYPNGPTCSGPLTSIEDANGNKITPNSTTYNGQSLQTSYTDTVGRNIGFPNFWGTNATTDLTGCTGSLPMNPKAYTWSVPGPNGGTDTYKMCLGTVTINLPNCQNASGPTTTRCIFEPNGQRVQSIVLPNGKAWTFSYDTWNGNSTTYAYGDLIEITTPAGGGSISYAWNSVPVTSVPCQTGPPYWFRGVHSRTVNANDGQGAHTYSYSSVVASGSYPPVTTTVTDPMGNQSVHTFSDVESFSTVNYCAYYETQRQNYQLESGSQVLLKTTTTAYNTAGYPPLPATITTTWPNSQVSQVQQQYDSASLGNVTSLLEYDYGSGAAGTLLRKTLTAYQYQSNAAYKTNNLIRLPSSITVQDVSGTQKAQTTFGYDEYSLTSSGATQHDTAPPTGSARGNQTSIHRWLNTNNTLITSTKTYYDSGTVFHASDPLGHVTTYGYSLTYQGAYPTTITNVLSQNTTNAYDFNTGLLTSTQDPNSQSTTYAYDNMKRVASVSYPDGGQTTFSYNDSVPSVTQTTIIDNTVSPTWDVITTTLMDGLNRVKQVQLTTDPQGTDYTDTTYDPLGRVWKQSNAHRSSSSATDGTTTHLYDALGRECLMVPQDITSIPTSCPTSAPLGDVFTSFSGACSTVTDQAGKARKSCVDGLGRMTQVFEDPTGLNYETDYSYSTLSDIQTVTQKGGSSSGWRTRSFAYDSLSRLVSATNPESGTVTYGYDADSNLITKVAPLPNQTSTATVATTYHYDVLDRLISKAYSDGTASVQYGYDGTALSGCATAPPSLSDPYRLGRRTAMCDGSGATSWSHDQMGRVASEDRTIMGNFAVTKTTSYQYNVDGSLNELTYGSGTTLNYSYSQAQHQDSLFDILHNINYADTATFTPPGLVSGYIRGNNSSFSGITTTINYNNRLQPTSISAKTSAATIFSLGYGYGGQNNGNVSTITNNLDGNRTQNFNYDALNRVAQASSAGPNWGEAYTTDAWGNMTAINSYQSKPYEGLNCGPANLKNQLTTCYGYDSAGNLIHSGSTTYTFDGENRIASTAGWTYVYDGDGNRVKKVSGTNGTLYWPDRSGQILTESGLSGSSQMDYVFFNGTRIARWDTTNLAAHYYFSNHLGSQNVVTNATGVCEQDIDYYPYGGQQKDYCAKVAQHYKFTGKERDAESGLDNFGARYNASSLGRFMTPDPSNLSVDFWLPQTWNRYAYALNNPLAVVDRNGLWPWYIHNEIIDQAFPGLSRSQLQTLKTASANVDKDQSPAGSYKHGMSNGDAVNNTTTPGDTSDYIHQNEQTAEQVQADWIASGHTGIAPGAMTAFGNALHTVTDMTSPAHEGYQLWYGTWDFFGVTAAYHFAREAYISDERRSAAVAAARRSFMITFGWMALQNATDGLTPKVTHKICYTDENGKQSCQ